MFKGFPVPMVVLFGPVHVKVAPLQSPEQLAESKTLAPQATEPLSTEADTAVGQVGTVVTKVAEPS